MNKKFLLLLAFPMFAGFSAIAGIHVQSGNQDLNVSNFCLNVPYGQTCCQHTLYVGNELKTVYNYQSGGCGTYTPNGNTYISSIAQTSGKTAKGTEFEMVKIDESQIKNESNSVKVSKSVKRK